MRLLPVLVLGRQVGQHGVVEAARGDAPQLLQGGPADKPRPASGLGLQHPDDARGTVRLLWNGEGRGGVAAHVATKSEPGDFFTLMSPDGGRLLPPFAAILFFDVSFVSIALGHSIPTRARSFQGMDINQTGQLGIKCPGFPVRRALVFFKKMTIDS